MRRDLRPPPPIGPGFRITREGLTRDPKREYVAGGSAPWYSRDIYHTLPQYIDAKTRDFGHDLYERMMLDPQVASCVHILKMGILSQPLELAPAIADEADPQYARAAEIRDFCQRCLSRLKKFHSVTLYNLLDALPLGHKVAEIVLQQPAAGIDKGKLVPLALKVKPRWALAFLVDPFMNVAGLLGILPGVAPALLGGTLVGDPRGLPNLLPRSKFLVLSYRPQDEDPRGQSLCNPAYDPWWMKVQAKPEYLKYLTQFAGPSIIGFTAPEAAPVQRQNASTGELEFDEDGNMLLLSPEENMLEALLAFRNGTAAAFPNGATVQPLSMSNEGNPFLQAFALFDAQIAKAILCQTLATEQAQHQARAAAETHSDVMGMVIRHGKECLAECLEDDLLRLLVEVNFGPEATGAGDTADLTPKVTFGDTEAQDLAGMGTAIAALETAGFLAPSQRRDIDLMLGLPPRTPEEVELAAQAHAAAAEALDQGQAEQGAAAGGGEEGTAGGEAPQGSPSQRGE